MIADSPPGFRETVVRKPRKLPPAAERALAEARERRLSREADERVDRPVELNGRNGPEPTRYGDWEKKGIISDF